MDNDTIGGLIGLAVFLVLPMLIGITLFIGAKSFARSRLRFFAGEGYHQEPAQAAVIRYRIIGLIFLIAPALILFAGIIVAMNSAQ